MMRRPALLLIYSLLIVAGCHHIRDEVSGSGNRAMQKRDVPSFSSISTQGAFDLRVVCQKPVSLEIEGDDNILPLVTTEVNNNVLYIKSTRSYSAREPIILKISVPNLDGVSASGAGRTDISGIKGDKFEIDATGAPMIKVSGEAKVIDIDTSGAAKIDTHKLHASQAVVESKGVSKVDLAVADKLDVTVSGPSRVTYEGNPVVNKTVHGPGSVEKKTTTEGA